MCLRKEIHIPPVGSAKEVEVDHKGELKQEVAGIPQSKGGKGQKAAAVETNDVRQNR